MITSPDMTKTRGYVGPASGEGERSEEGGGGWESKSEEIWDLRMGRVCRRGPAEEIGLKEGDGD